jgi:hypothetical protein
LLLVLMFDVGVFIDWWIWIDGYVEIGVGGLAIGLMTGGLLHRQLIDRSIECVQ